MVHVKTEEGGEGKTYVYSNIGENAAICLIYKTEVELEYDYVKHLFYSFSLKTTEICIEQKMVKL